MVTNLPTLLRGSDARPTQEFSKRRILVVR